MRAWLKRASQWLWIPAVLSCVTGVVGIADLSGADNLSGDCILLAPHVAAVGLTAWGCWRHPASAVIALVGSLGITGLTWYDNLTRQTEGFEWQFNNGLAGMLCCGANYIVLATVAFVALLVPQLVTPTVPDCQGRDLVTDEARSDD